MASCVVQMRSYATSCVEQMRSYATSCVVQMRSYATSCVVQMRSYATSSVVQMRSYATVYTAAHSWKVLLPANYSMFVINNCRRHVIVICGSEYKPF